MIALDLAIYVLAFVVLFVILALLYAIDYIVYVFTDFSFILWVDRKLFGDDKYNHYKD